MTDDLQDDSSESDVIVQGRGTIEAYINRVNMISLKQTDAHDENIIVIDRYDVPLVVERLRKLADMLDKMNPDRREDSIRVQQPR